MYWYRISRWSSTNTSTGKTSTIYKAEWRRGLKGRWHIYYNGSRSTWDAAYRFLAMRAGDGALAVRFVGTY